MKYLEKQPITQSPVLSVRIAGKEQIIDVPNTFEAMSSVRVSQRALHSKSDRISGADELEQYLRMYAIPNTLFSSDTFCHYVAKRHEQLHTLANPYMYGVYYHAIYRENELVGAVTETRSSYTPDGQTLLRITVAPGYGAMGHDDRCIALGIAEAYKSARSMRLQAYGHRLLAYLKQEFAKVDALSNRLLIEKGYRPEDGYVIFPKDTSGYLFVLNQGKP